MTYFVLYTKNGCIYGSNSYIQMLYEIWQHKEKESDTQIKAWR